MVSIPVFSIIVRNNLVQNKICGYKTATFFSHILPWICVLPFQTGTLINDVINWTSLFFVSTANFIIPIIIYLKCLKFKEELNENHYFTPRQRELLKTIHWQSKTIQGFIDSYPTIKIKNLDKKQKEKIDEEEVINNTTISTNETEQNMEYKEKIYENKNNTSSESLNTYTNEPPNIYLYKPTNNPGSPLYNNQDNDDSKSNNLLVPPPPATMPPPSPELTNFSHRPTALGTLPMHPLFISNYFKGIPDWIPCSPKTFAKICLYIISVIIVGIIGLNVYKVVHSFNDSDNFNSVVNTTEVNNSWNNNLNNNWNNNNNNMWNENTNRGLNHNNGNNGGEGINNSNVPNLEINGNEPNPIKENNPPEDIDNPDPWDIDNPSPEDIHDPDPKDIDDPDPKDIDDPNPEDIDDPNPEDIDDPNPEDIDNPNPEDIDNPDPEDIDDPGPEDIDPVEGDIVDDDDD